MKNKEYYKIEDLRLDIEYFDDDNWELTLFEAKKGNTSLEEVDSKDEKEIFKCKSVKPLYMEIYIDFYKFIKKVINGEEAIESEYFSNNPDDIYMKFLIWANSDYECE